MSVTEVVTAALLLTGTAFTLLGAIGLQRFGDVLSRMHAATKPVTLGLACVLAGAALVQTDVAPAAKLLLAAILQFVTAPVGAHMVGRASYRAGTNLDPRTDPDELAGVSIADSNEVF